MAAEETPEKLGLYGQILIYNMYLQNPTDSKLFSLFSSCACPFLHPELKSHSLLEDMQELLSISYVQNCKGYSVHFYNHRV